MTRRVGVERIEKVALKELAKQDGPHDGVGVWLIAPDIVKLLRRELAKRDARVRRIVKRKQGEYDGYTMYSQGYQDACDDILAALSGRKGTR